MRKTRGRPRKKGEGDADTPLFPGFKPKPEGLSGEQHGPESESEDDEVIEGLTLYEMHRQPLTPIMGDTTSSLQIRTLNVELTCPVCLGIIRRTMTVMECLHRFCADCISKSLRWGKKECPTCRVHCSSRRHLRPDPNFDALIAAVYPDLDEYEAQEDSFIADINRSLNRKALTESVERGIRRQAQASRPNRKRKSATTAAPSTPSPLPPPAKMPRPTKKAKSNPAKPGKKAALAPKPTNNKGTAPTQPAPDESLSNSDHYHIRKKKHLQQTGEIPQETPPKPEWVNFVFSPHPNERRLHELDKKYLKMKRTATIRHLTLFLIQKFPHLESSDNNKIALQESSFRVSIQNTTTNQFVPLPKELTLGAVENEHWNKREDMVLNFSLSSTPVV